MEPKISKVQEEVWAWKEKAWQSVSHLPMSAALLVIRSRTAATVQQLRQRRKAENPSLGQ
ncbi:MAG: hypothetical protein SF053_08905 [Bacteroidia bacterium]|nr:hypothetical protein [Bacteroidia bacterium]